MGRRFFGCGLTAVFFLAQACGSFVTSASKVPLNPSDLSTMAEPSLTSSGYNPFLGAEMYVDQKFVTQVKSSIDRAPQKSRELSLIASQSTAIWLDRIAAIDTLQSKLEAARAQKIASGKSVVISFVIYNLPERDCAANASNGEINTENGGLARYKSEYIDPIVTMFSQYPDLRIVAIVEPDSLPNLATNTHLSRCQLAAPIYREGVIYALRSLAMPHVSIYLDVAHGGWLGWEDNRFKIAQIFRQVLDQAGGSSMVRGFATNVANYSPLNRANPDPLPDSYYQWNPARDELTYVQKLSDTFASFGIENRNFIIDTSRNGNPIARRTWGNWCNIAEAGIGERPKAAPVAGVDAFLWVKIPGESDGVSQPGAPRFDLSCQSSDSLLGAPQAGEWFHEHLMSMIDRANPSL